MEDMLWKLTGLDNLEMCSFDNLTTSAVMEIENPQVEISHDREGFMMGILSLEEMP